MAVLTKEQKEKYLKEGAGACPFCESPDIVGGPIEVDSTIAWQEVSCSQCGEDWNDLYKLFAVEDPI